MNKLALDIAKVASDTKDPNFHRDANGKLDCVLFEEAVSVFSAFILKISPTEFIGLARTTLKSWAARGTTTVLMQALALPAAGRK